VNKVHKIISCLKTLEFKPHIKKFEDRLILQKVIYLLKLNGVDTGFDYGFYIRGPYSPELTREMYCQQNAFENLDSKLKLTPEENKKVEELKRLFGLDPGLLEVAATYGYFVIEKKLSPVEALKRVKKFKSFFSETQLAVGISRFKQLLFRPSAEEIAGMKQEVAVWQKVAIKRLGG